MHILPIITLGLVTAVMAVASTVLPDTKLITLNEGTLEGVKQPMGDDRFFYSFRGIPYAGAPMGELRFKNPSPVAVWSGIRNAFDPPKCPQFDMTAFFDNKIVIQGQEDCLYLHVYTPQPDEDAQLPVMVYIHGGAFTLGDADNFGGTPRPLVENQIVLVSIQYRLGSLGFMSTGDSVLPGNFGMKDQTFALEWVKKNIHLFGGDPEKVTIFGESAGAGSSHFHMVAPTSRGLFQRAILQSGVSFTPWAIRSDHAERAKAIAKHFECPGAADSTPDSNDLLECFMSLSAEQLVEASLLDTVSFFPFYMVPRVDDDYLPEHPAKLLREGKHNSVDVMSGVCQNEGAAMTLGIMLKDTLKSMNETKFDDLIRLTTIGLENEGNGLYMARRSVYHYLGSATLTEENAADAERLLADMFFKVPHDEATALHARDAAYGKHTYRYELHHRSEQSLLDMMNITAPYAKNWVGHSDDLLYLNEQLFGVPRVSRPDDRFLSDIMVSLWSNFAKFGNPTPNLDLGFKWEPMTSPEDMRYLSLTPSPSMQEDTRAKDREFWRSLPTKTNKYLHPDRFHCTVEAC